MEEKEETIKLEDRCCKNCKHWEKVYHKQITGTCKKAETPDSLAIADDGYYNYGMLITQPNFYCNQWVRKKELESND